MKASLDVLACADTRTAAILGDMFELGENSAKMHYEVGAHAADAGINVLIGIGELSAETVRGAEETAAEKGLSMEIRHFASKEDFFRESETLLKEKDTILIKASHGMEFTEIVDRLKEPVRNENI